MALTYDDAVAAARAFLASSPFPYPEYRHALTTGRPAADGWYFNFSIERVDGQPMPDEPVFGGALASSCRLTVVHQMSSAGTNGPIENLVLNDRTQTGFTSSASLASG